MQACSRAETISFGIVVSPSPRLSRILLMCCFSGEFGSRTSSQPSRPSSESMVTGKLRV